MLLHIQQNSVVTLKSNDIEKKHQTRLKPTFRLQINRKRSKVHIKRGTWVQFRRIFNEKSTPDPLLLCTSIREKRAACHYINSCNVDPASITVNTNFINLLNHFLLFNREYLESMRRKSNFELSLQ